MSASEGPGRAGAPALTSLPRYEDLPRVGDSLDPERVREAFDEFRRHAAQLPAQLRVRQAAGTRPGPSVEPTGHAVAAPADEPEPPARPEASEETPDESTPPPPPQAPPPPVSQPGPAPGADETERQEPES